MSIGEIKNRIGISRCECDSRKQVGLLELICKLPSLTLYRIVVLWRIWCHHWRLPEVLQRWSCAYRTSKEIESQVWWACWKVSSRWQPSSTIGGRNSLGWWLWWRRSSEGVWLFKFFRQRRRCKKQLRGDGRQQLHEWRWHLYLLMGNWTFSEDCKNKLNH